MGNGQSRLSEGRDMAQRRGSISWNFRYPAMRRRDGPTMMVYNEKLSVADWLDLLNLLQYESNLQMYNRVEDILELTDNDLRQKGVNNAGHRAKMLSSLVGVQAKRRQSMNIEVSTLPRSMAKRKNSCPPIYLSDALDVSYSVSPNVKNRHSLAAPRYSLDYKRLTFACDERNSIYEELKPPSVQEEQPICTETDSSATNNMENGSSTQNLSMQSTANSAGTSPTPTNEQQEAIALKKALEWELSLDAKDLRSHAWYHGPLPRQRAEEIVQKEGDFLIRDCTSQPGNYVLTCRTKAAVLHFVINKILLQPETVYERVQYQFEEDAFDAIPDLITFYVGSGKPISAASGARIQHPCNRTYPLSFYGHKIVGNQLHTQMLAGIRGASPLNSPIGNNGAGIFRFGSSGPQSQQTPPQTPQMPSPMSPPRNKRDTPPRLPSKKQRSQSLTPVQATLVSNMKHAETCSSADGVIQANGKENGVHNANETNSNGVGFKGGRRFSNLEKCHSSSISSSPSESQLNTPTEHSPHGKVHANGFQTIARCSVGEAVDHVKFTTHSLPRISTHAYRSHCSRISSLARDFSLDSAGLGNKQIPELPEKAPSPPPKPVRAPSLPRKEKELAAEQQQQAIQRAGYQASGSDSGNGSGDSVQSSIPGDNEFTNHRGVIIKNPRFMSNSASSATLKSLTEFDAIAAEEQLFTMDIPEFKPISKFDFENFSTLLLPSVDNKPLDGDALSTFKMMLLETGPKLIAEHLTRIDIALFIDELLEDDEHNTLDCCGLEMLTLPQGKIFRDDLIERTQCIKLMVAVTILTCQTDLDRAELLSKWIQIAVETKTALGNLFGFCAIMLGLCMQQIQRLEQAWHILRQKYTDSAFTFEAKLRPILISMNECANPQAPNTTVPHVLLYALLKDRAVMDILNIGTTVERVEKSSLYTTCITSWESKADDFGMSINFLHLDSGRGFLRNLELFRKNAKNVLEESNSRLDELLSDAFRTEFHVKFLWGSKGALATPDDRHSKLEKVLGLMTDKFCSVEASNTAAA